VFLLTKSAKYFYDADAVAEPAIHGELFHGAYDKRPGATRERNGRSDAENTTAVRNLRNVWTIPTQGFSGAHFATMAPDLAERCVKAGSRPGDTVLDPFGGAGTTAMVADRLKRNAILIELNPEYAEIARNRISDDAGMFAEVA
jgi:DNA modification methylase